MLPFRIVLAVAAVLLVGPAASVVSTFVDDVPTIANDAAIRPSLQPAFIANRGQWHPEARFQVRTGNVTTWVTDEGMRISMTPDGTDRAASIFLTFEGRPSAALGESAQRGRFNFFLGDDPAAWVTEVPAFDAVRWPGKWKGIDAVVGERDGRLEWDVILGKGADLSDVVFRIDGAHTVSVKDGALVATTDVGDLIQTPPVAWDRCDDGARRPVACTFVHKGGNRYGFSAPDHDPTAELVVDPAIVYGGYLGGSNYDSCYAITTNAAGEAFITGRTNSSNFPTVPGSYDVTIFNSFYDAFVTKLNTTGTARVWSTFLGGSGSDWGNAIKVDANGAVYVTGMCDTAFPVTTGSYDTSYNAFGDTFVTKIQPAGNALAWSTFLGGNNEDRGQALAVDATGAVYVAGQTMSTNFPATTGAYDTTANGNWDAFVAKFTPTGNALGFSTRLGGADIDWAMSLAVDPQGQAIVSGGTASPAFPTTLGAFDRIHNGGSLDAFVTKVNAAGNGLVWSTFLGGIGTDQVFGSALDATGNVFVTGGAGLGFPTTPGALIGTGDGSDAFVTCVASNGSSVVWSTLLGGSSTDQGNEICVDAVGRAIVGGWTNSANFPTTPDAMARTFNGGGSPADSFVAKVQPGGAVLIYSTYIGGNGYDEGTSLAIDDTAHAYICGGGLSTNLPVTTTALSGPAGLDDGFVMKITLPTSPTSITVGSGCGSGSASPTFVSAPPTLGQPVPLSGAQALPGSAAYILVSDLPSSPMALGGNCEVYFSVSTAIIFATLVVPSDGSWSIAPTVVNNPLFQGVPFRLQALFATPTSPLGFELSNGVEVQPGY